MTNSGLRLSSIRIRGVDRSGSVANQSRDAVLHLARAQPSCAVFGFLRSLPAVAGLRSHPFVQGAWRRCSGFLYKNPGGQAHSKCFWTQPRVSNPSRVESRTLPLALLVSGETRDLNDLLLPRRPDGRQPRCQTGRGINGKRWRSSRITTSRSPSSQQTLDPARKPELSHTQSQLSRWSMSDVERSSHTRRACSSTCPRMLKAAAPGRRRRHVDFAPPSGPRLQNKSTSS